MKTVTLSNGLRIVLDKIENLRTCAFGVMVASGSGYETPETAGTSHFIEHMLFRGTQKRTALELAVEMDEIGGRMNAYTTSSLTYFYAHTLTEHLPKAMDIICDIIMNSKLSPEDIELEKGVIKEEIAMYKDSPEDVCLDTYYENIWKGSPLANNILGTVENVEGITREKLLAHMKNFYVPERMVVTVSGNFDEEIVLQICGNYFGAMENTGNTVVYPSAVYQPEIVTVEKDFSQNQLILGFNGVTLENRRECRIADYVSSILAGSSSSRLFQNLREKLGLVYSVDSTNACHPKAGLMLIDMGLGRKSEKKAIRETLKILENFSSDITEREVAVTREHIVSSFVMGSESVTARASKNARSLLNYGFIEPDESRIESIRSVTLDEVRNLSERIFDLKNISLCAVGKVHTKEEYKEYLCL